MYNSFKCTFLLSLQGDAIELSGSNQIKKITSYRGYNGIDSSFGLKHSCYTSTVTTNQLTQKSMTPCWMSNRWWSHNTRRLGLNGFQVRRSSAMWNHGQTEGHKLAIETPDRSYRLN